MDNVTRPWDDLDDADIATPNCPQCLQRMDLREFDIGVAWWCADCDSGGRNSDDPLNLRPA